MAGTCHTSTPVISPNITKQTNKQTNSVAFSPQANYNDCATATCWQNLVPTFADRGVSRGQRGGYLTAVNLFSRLQPLIFIQVAPYLFSQGLSGPRSRPTATQKIWQQRESNPGPLCLQPGTLTTISQRRPSDDGNALKYPITLKTHFYRMVSLHRTIDLQCHLHLGLQCDSFLLLV
jgi:hypothetical protein